MNTQSNDPFLLRAIIDAQKAEIDRLKAALKEARRDELTRLPKRTELMDVAAKALSKGHLPTSMIFLDLNGFKEINDKLGHDAGDSLLTQFAQFLKDEREALGEKAALVTIARLGGDEFAILLTHTSFDEAQNFVKEVKKSLSERVFTVNISRVQLRSAMGVATTGPGISTVSELLHHADKEMYADKQRMEKSGEVTKRRE